MANRLLYSAERVHALLGQVRDQMRAEMRVLLREMDAQHRAEVAVLRAEFDNLRAVSLARSKAELELGELYRQRDLERAAKAERDPTVPLN